ncbi:MAG: hypothetical protein K1X53_12380 [Candidatus Sumerlaeaceae bacterium]|nr:hypothetical protein [Candidatus Sumerlaeaceae bacterium]
MLQPPDWQPGISARSPFWFKIPIREKGLYRIGASDLQSSGVALSDVTPDSLHLYLNGTEVPMHFVSKSGNRDNLAPSDSFVFLGNEPESPYSDTNIYWLFSDPSKPGLRLSPTTPMETNTPADNALIFAETIRVEEDIPPVLTKNDQFLSILSYRWVGKELTTSEPFTMRFDAPDLARWNGDAVCTLFVYAHTWAPGTQLKVGASINGGKPSELSMTSESNDTLVFRVPTSGLQTAANTLQLQLRDESSTAVRAGYGPNQPRKTELFFDKLEVRYPRQFRANNGKAPFHSPIVGLSNLNDPTTESRLLDYRISNAPATDTTFVYDVTGTTPLLLSPTWSPDSAAPGMRTASFRVREDSLHHYELASIDQLPRATFQPQGGRENLTAPGTAADYIIITHPAFEPAIQKFATWKQGQGYKVKVVTTTDIYEQFSAGQFTPVAIRQFLQYAAANWQGSAANPAGTFVLLVGDCTSAYKNDFHNSITNWLPSYTRQANPGSGDRFASDHWYTELFGDDLYGDALVGRLSVNNVRDLDTIISKSMAYASETTHGVWQNTLGFVADHTEFEEAVLDTMRHAVPPRFFLKTVFVGEEPWIDNYYIPLDVAEGKRAKVSAAATGKIRDLFNNGAAIISYFGHGSPNIWSNERVWFGGDSENSDNLVLTNRDKLPIVFTMTCNSGAIDYPMPRWNVNISEDMLRVPNGGAIACYVPSGPGVTDQHKRFVAEIFPPLLNNQPGTFLAAPLLLGGWRYLAGQNPTDLVQMFILLGDPALELHLPAPLPDVRVEDQGSGKFGVPVPEPIKSGGYSQTTTEGDPFLPGAITPISAGTGSITVQIGNSKTDAPRGRTGLLGTTGEFASAGAPLEPAPQLAVRSWHRKPEGAVFQGDPVNYVFTVENQSRHPIKAGTLQISEDNGAVLAKSPPVSLVPGETVTLSLEITAQAKPQKILVSEQIGKGPPNRILLPEPIILAGARRTSSQAPPVALIPNEIKIRYSASEGNDSGWVSFDACNMTTEPVAAMEAALTTADGTVASGTLTTIPTVPPGGKATVQIRRDFPPDISLENLFVRFDPLDRIPDSNSWPKWPVELGRKLLPDIEITTESVIVTPAKPVDGETVFLDVPVTNRGKSMVDNVRVDAFDGTSTDSRRLDSRVTRPTTVVKLEPGMTRTIRVRWDPFRNAGDHQIVLTAVAGNSTPETSLANNSVIIPLHVSRKYSLRRDGLTVLQPTPEQLRAREVTVVARVRNDGESPARLVKVVFYPVGHHGEAAQAVGEVILDEVPPQSSAEARLTYRLRPGDEKKDYLGFTFDAFLKGSLQRMPPPNK